MPFAFKWPQRIHRQMEILLYLLNRFTNLMNCHQGDRHSFGELVYLHGTSFNWFGQQGQALKRSGTVSSRGHATGAGDLSYAHDGTPSPDSSHASNGLLPGDSHLSGRARFIAMEPAERVRSAMVAPEAFWPCQVAVASYSCSRSDLCRRWNNLSRQFPRSLFV